MTEFEKGYQAYLNKIPFSAHEPMEWIDGYMQAMNDITDEFLKDVDDELL
jgi:hypothetical protein